MSRRTEILDRILAERIIAVIRVDLPIDRTLTVVDAVAASGIRIIEVTLTTPDATTVIERLSGRTDLLVGAGTVLDESDAQRAFEAGADFFASPVADIGLVHLAGDLDRVSMPGALTPTEILSIWRAGADLVKVFPMPSEGARYLRAITAPLRGIPLAPSGGISPETAGPLLDAGAVALNVGTWLTHETDGSLSPERVITERGARLCEAVLNRSAGPPKA
jgi:2-dehydro-3-deoxyphosphogluconate aldolase/(4S)-4-hydroxy-2-oxoglutarate aldolase